MSTLPISIRQRHAKPRNHPGLHLACRTRVGLPGSGHLVQSFGEADADCHVRQARHWPVGPSGPVAQSRPTDGRRPRGDGCRGCRAGCHHGRVRRRIARGVVCRHPERCSALILYGSFARFSDWFPTKQKFEGFLNYVETAWGTGKSIAAFAPSKKADAEFQRWWGRFERLGGSPSAVINLMRMNSGINIENILPSISVPTLVLHRTEDPTVSIQAGRFLAAHIPCAKLVELDGPDHVYYVGDNAMQIADLVADFAARPGTEAQSTTASRRMLATILFTDIVDSTSRACELGDKGGVNYLR